MAENRKIYFISGAILLATLIIGGFIFYTVQDGTKKAQQGSGPYGAVAESNGAVLMADTGLDIEWLESREDGRRQIFERYRLINKAQFEQFTGTEVQVNSIDITQDNAEVFLTYPDGSREDVASDTPYVRFSILPPQPEGTYKLDVKLNSGKEYNFKFNYEAPKEIGFSNTGKTQTLEIPDAEHDIFHRSEAELNAYALGGLNLNKASKVFHITPGGGAYGGALEEARANAGINEYFWLDTELLRDNYDAVQESIANLQQADRSELGQTELDYLERYERPTAFEHIFLANIDGIWHYAKANYPEDF